MRCYNRSSEVKNVRKNPSEFVQAGEKAIKAILYLNNTLPWGHSITTLIEEYEDLGNEVEEEIKLAAIALDPHYTASRYPGELLDVAPSDAYANDEVSEIKCQAELLLNLVYREKRKWEEKGGDLGGI